MLVAPLIALNDFHGSKNESESQKLFWAYFSLCPHDDATHGSLSVFTKLSLQNFTAHSICFTCQSLFFDSTLQPVGNKITKSVQESRLPVSRFSTACLQTLNERKQQSKNFFFRLLGYSATHGEETDTKIEILRLKRIMKAYKKLYRKTG